MHGSAPGGTPERLVAATASLLRARKVWLSTFLTYVLALLAYGFVGLGVLGNVTNHSTGAFGTVIAVIASLQAAIAVAALVTVAVCTVRLRLRGQEERSAAARQLLFRDQEERSEAARQLNAAGQAAGDPGHAAGHRRSRSWQLPMRAAGTGRTGRVLGLVWLWSMLAFMPLVVTGYLPQQVNAIAYLAGAGPTAQFAGQSHFLSCAARGCVTVTAGTLLDPPVSATWPGRAALHRPFPVRRPAWAGWGPPVQLMDGSWAVASLVFGIFLDLIFIGFIIAAAFWVRGRLRSRREDGPQSHKAAGGQDRQAAGGQYPEWLLRRYRQ